MAPTQANIEMLPVSAVAFALGLTVGKPHDIDTAQRVVALIGELRRRGVYPDLLASLDAGLAHQLSVLETMSRGQVWSQGGRRP
jgi:hypothetical protein